MEPLHRSDNPMGQKKGALQCEARPFLYNQKINSHQTWRGSSHADTILGKLGFWF